MKVVRVTVALAGLWLALGVSARAGEATVAVVSAVQPPLQKIAAALHARTGHTVRLIPGSNAGLLAQIQKGDPIDAFFAADDEQPAQLEQAGLGVKGSRFTYALGKLVLWSPQPNLLDPKGDVLLQGHFKHIALANPKAVPYGAAAQQTLAMMGLWEATDGKRVVSDALGPTYQVIASGGAELGFVALSQVMADSLAASGSQWVVPGILYNPIHQDAILLKHGARNPAAKALLEFVHSSQGRALIRGFGYEVP